MFSLLKFDVLSFIWFAAIARMTTFLCEICYLCKYNLWFQHNPEYLIQYTVQLLLFIFKKQAIIE